MEKLSLLAVVSDMQSNLSSSLSLTLLCALAEGNEQVCQKLTSSYNLLEVNDEMKCNYIVLGTQARSAQGTATQRLCLSLSLKNVEQII